MTNVSLSHGGPGLLSEGSSSTGPCAAHVVHKPICNSHLQARDIPAPGEGSSAQLMPVTSILCWVTQGGAGQLAASPGAWKRPRCQCRCERRAPRPPCCPRSLGQHLPPCPSFPTAQYSPTDPASTGTLEGRTGAAELSSLCTSVPAETPRPRSPSVEGTSPHCPACQTE